MILAVHIIATLAALILLWELFSASEHEANQRGLDGPRRMGWTSANGAIVALLALVLFLGIWL